MIRFEETLDPDSWEEITALGTRMVKDMMNHLENIRHLDTVYPTKEAINNILTPLTGEGEGIEKTYEIFLENILPYTPFHTKPRFWGVVAGTGSPYGMLAEMLKGALNGGVEVIVADAYVNRQAINWVKELLDFPETYSGVFTGGGSEANFTALAVARNTKAQEDMKEKGMQGQPSKMVLYCSDEAHACIERSVELLGLGNKALRWVPTDDNHMVKIPSLRSVIKKDRERGYHPFCIIGNAGTVNAGAFDDFKALRKLADQEDMWLHIDGAFGSWVKLSKTHRYLAEGLEEADSLAVDLHKWMYMPYGIGCTLVRDRLEHYKTFVYGHDAEYIKSGKSLSVEELSSPINLALPLSRGFSSLKVYMLLRAYGKDKYRRLIQQNLDQIQYLAGLFKEDPNFEILAPVQSNIVCFRYVKKWLSDVELEELNKAILAELYKINFWMISDTVSKDMYMLRACCTNHRSRKEVFDYLYNKIKELATELIS
jgi:glutamate/tyrosine decarboxylase-like PLP-dependent enzyme